MYSKNFSYTYCFSSNMFYFWDKFKNDMLNVLIKKPVSEENLLLSEDSNDGSLMLKIISWKTLWILCWNLNYSTLNFERPPRTGSEGTFWMDF